ncbi:hypothetical protein [Sphingobacterium bambusae]|nr:hypothetical protein [Sphingobacterium bambusae]WPL48795.1 hypothetical protein SCB77_22855 [Sphingobacterium bambusae]
MPYMEITIETIQEARLLGITKEYNPYVKRFKTWHSLVVDDLVLGKIKKNTEALYTEITRLKAQLATPPNRQRTHALKRLATIINFQKAELSKAILTNNINHLLIFLETHRYFETPYENYLTDITFSPAQLTELAKTLLPLLARFGIELKKGSYARYHEQSELEAYNQGIINFNIDKVYTLINSVENSKGIHLPFRLRSLLRFLFVIDINIFRQYIDGLKTPINYVAALEWMSAQQLATFFKGHTSAKKWLLFEGIRQLVARKSSVDSLLTAKYLLIKLYDQDKNFFIQICNYENRSPSFNQILGSCLAIIPTLTPDLINQLFKIGQYTFFVKNKDLLLDAFLNDASDDRIEILLYCIHKKWLAYLDSLPQEIDFNVLHPVLTDYANYVVKYLCRSCTIDETKKLWDEAYFKIENIDSKWHRTQPSRLTYFMILFGKLYLYTLSLIDSEHIDTMKNKFLKLLNNSIFMSRYGEESVTANLISVSLVIAHIKDLLKIKAEEAK